MDGTICDFMTPFVENGGNENGVYPQSEKGFFKNLKEYDDVVQSIDDIMEEYDVWFLTRPSMFNTHCYTEKAEWIRDRFGIKGLYKLILSPNKALFDVNEDDFLIDDYGGDGQSEFKGCWIKYSNDKYPWSDWKTWLIKENGESNI